MQSPQSHANGSVTASQFPLNPQSGQPGKASCGCPKGGDFPLASPGVLEENRRHAEPNMKKTIKANQQ
jgi:hypothetical protein